MECINIAIVDDHVMVREGIKQLLELDGDIKVIGEASDGIECLNMLKHINPDVLLLDINMPRLNGLEVLQKLKKANSKVRVLLLTIHNEIEYLMKAVEIGVNGYVLKDSDSDLLKKAVFVVFNNDTFIQPSLAPLLNSKLMNDQKLNKSNSSILTNREYEVLVLLSEGLFNKEIGAILGISEKTVKNHVSSIFKKIDVSDRTQAALYAIKNNLVALF